MNTRIISLRRSSGLLWLIGMGIATFALFCWPQAAANGVRQGLSIAVQAVIPGCFPFLILGGWLSQSGLPEQIGAFLSRRFKRRPFPVHTLVVWLIGTIGGYPAAAVAVNAAVRNGQLSPAAARRLIAGCTGAGPGFCVATVGGVMLGSVTHGLILWAAHAVAGLIVLLGFPAPRETSKPPAPPPVLPGTALIRSVYDAADSLLKITAFITLASVGLSLLSAAFPALLAAPFACLIEVTSGCLSVRGAPFWLGWALGFGGLSVGGQIAVLAPRGTVGRSFLVARLVHGCLGGLLTLWWLPPPDTPTFVTLSGVSAEPFASASVLGGLSLIALCVTWLASMRKKVDF